MTISKELLDELLSGVERPEDLLGDKGRFCRKVSWVVSIQAW
jgi:hypothetical protein